MTTHKKTSTLCRKKKKSNGRPQGGLPSEKVIWPCPRLHNRKPRSSRKSSLCSEAKCAEPNYVCATAKECSPTKTSVFFAWELNSSVASFYTGSFLKVDAGRTSDTVMFILLYTSSFSRFFFATVRTSHLYTHLESKMASPSPRKNSSPFGSSSDLVRHRCLCLTTSTNRCLNNIVHVCLQARTGTAGCSESETKTETKPEYFA